MHGHKRLGLLVRTVDIMAYIYDANTVECQFLQEPDGIREVTRHARRVIDEEYVKGERPAPRCGTKSLDSWTVETGARNRGISVDVISENLPPMRGRITPGDGNLIVNRGFALEIARE